MSDVRNQIFGADSIHQQVMQPTPDQMRSASAAYEIPVETVPLPSSGKVYPSGSPLANKTTVEIRSMTAREEDILTSRALIKKGTVITELLRSCLIDKSLDVRNMLSGDRNAIMVALRITGYGAEYQVEVACPACNERVKQEFDLSTLPIKRLAIDPVAPGENLFAFTLPISKKTVQFRFLTGHDEEEMAVSQERKKKTGMMVDNLVTTRLQYTLMSVDGNTDKQAISNFIRNMPARDSLLLRRFIDDNEPGIEMKGELTCSACGHSEVVDMPMGATFFWPDAGR